MKNNIERIEKLQARMSDTEAKRAKLRERRSKDKGAIFSVCIALVVLLIIGLAAFILFDVAGKSNDIDSLRSAARTLVIVFAILLSIVSIAIICIVRASKNRANLKLDADIKELSSRIEELEDEIADLRVQ